MNGEDTTAPLPSTWADRDRPILRAALRRLDAGEDFPNLEEIRHEVGLDVQQMRAGLRALENSWPPYLTVRYYLGGSDIVAGHVTAVSERTRREFGTWPSPEAIVERLADALTRAADAEDEPQRKSRLRAAGEALAGFARDVAVGVVAAHIP